jgi:hypothetical protein
MRSYHRLSSSGAHCIFPQAEPLENRTLLSGSAASQKVAIQVPSTYVSQQADQLTVTLVRSGAEGGNRNLRPTTIHFSASEGSPTAGGMAADTSAPPQFTPVGESVTFPQGVTTESVVVPINSGAPNPGLVPIQLSVTATSRGVRGGDQMIYLANSQEAIPPSIVGVTRVAGGIAVTFSKPMDPSTVQNIYNYAVKFSPSQKFSLGELTGFGLIETLNSAKQGIALRRATYNAATNTVLLVANEQLGANGSYTVRNPVSLTAKRNGPNKAHALSDLQGNALAEGGTAGVFSITISKGHPYAAATPVLSDGS